MQGRRGQRDGSAGWSDELPGLLAGTSRGLRVKGFRGFIRVKGFRGFRVKGFRGFI
jgi:hypothetical protein